MTVGIVAEGTTDLLILDRLVTGLLGPDVGVRWIQPQQSPSGDHGPDGSGWRGVGGWCRSFVQQQPLQAGLVDLLVVHLDADVAGRDDFREEEGLMALPCPPACATVNLLRDRLHEWLGKPSAAGVVRVVPSKSTEAWLLVAHFTNWHEHVPEVECEPDPAICLTRRPFKLLGTRSDGRPRKSKKEYEVLAERLVGEWERVRLACREAERFHLDLTDAAVT